MILRSSIVSILIFLFYNNFGFKYKKSIKTEKLQKTLNTNKKNFPVFDLHLGNSR